MGLISIKCNSCGSCLDMDVKKLMMVCTYCGSKMMYAFEDVLRILETAIIEGEKTNRIKIENDTEIKKEELKYKKERNDDLSVIMMLGLMVLMIVLIVIFALYYVQKISR